MEATKRSMVGTIVAVILILAVAAPASAIVTNKFAVGVVIPYAIYDDAGRDTVIGIAATPSTGRKIYWSFIDANGNLLASDTISTSTNNVYVYSFSLSAALHGTGGAPDVGKGVPGYLVMIDDNDGTLGTGENSPIMAANAFLVNLSDFDAVYLPVVPLNRSDLVNSNIDLLNFPPNDLLTLTNGHYNQSPFVRFLTGAGGDPRTELIVFTPTDGPANFDAEAVSPSGTILVGIQIPTTARRLNVFDVDSIPALTFNEGYLILGSTVKFGLVFALTKSSIVGAEQTIIGLGN